MLKTLPLDHAELSFDDRGTGPVVVLVHGFPLDHTMWQHQIEALAGDYRVLSPDLRGFGRSTGASMTTTMQRMADDLAAMLDGLGIAQPVTLCGLSMGGYVAWEFWRKYGNRLGALVLCDTRAAPDSPEAAANRRKVADDVMTSGPAPVAESLLPKLFAPQSLEKNREVVEQVRRSIESADARAIAAAQRGMAARSDFTDRLGDIDVPALVLVGSEDAITPATEMRAMAEAMPRARFFEIAGAGHMAPLEDPQACNAHLLAFLAEHAN
jgi:pimeloyl-ACP methyl ester carboxylesterase